MTTRDEDQLAGISRLVTGVSALSVPLALAALPRASLGRRARNILLAGRKASVSLRLVAPHAAWASANWRTAERQRQPRVAGRDSRGGASADYDCARERERHRRLRAAA
jgi:hypothetical protein